ncbi:MAG TPA: CDP-glycerol glycerophosphotransferase family protein [Candidatus Limnocylindrales bacterium]|nr:CDP-glycerol glycerophosphotransferase family protein [Candidatus Limnocylindrales bacterium]
MSRRQTRLRAALTRAGFGLGRLVPIRPRVVLATNHADRLSGNLAWIAEGLATWSPGVARRVLAHRNRAGRRGSLRAAIDHLVAGWYLATSRLVVVDDYYFPMYAIRPRPGTTFVQAWHACGAFKRFGYSVLDRSFGADEGFVTAFPIHTNYDLCLVSAMRFAPFYAEAFREPLDRFTSRLGIPRTDLFFDGPRRTTAERRVRERYAIPDGRRVILYAPTFRGDRIDVAENPSTLDLVALRQRLGGDHTLLLRAHPFVAARLRDRTPRDGFVIDVSDHDDMNELLLVADVLVTDYSSAMYEFALLERPIVFFAPDHAAYEGERGFYLDFPADLPGPVFERTEDLADWLRHGPADLERVRRFRAESFDVADGGSTRRFIEEVVRPALMGRRGQAG